ncbi:MAG: polyprenyl synthetase family protein [Defluviitaleaceae bacterium]|nr:polyprenyl synthetase family protein [Defluviitaleaceae bacterium]MCL2239050.1 polyprenyl synthetase family protein [Defluviitaleaceae bacterium]
MIKEIDARLEALINTCEEPRLRDAMRYSALGAGKRLRPRLLLASCEAARGSYDATALDFACCLEMIHAYSLAHDDLPAMDNDDLRRGAPTTHKQFDEATAILAGDALLNHAFETMSRLCADFFRLRRPALAMSIIAKAAGANGMIAGQMMDLQSEGKAIDIETLKGIHRRKTGALFTAAMEAGAVLGGGTRLFVQGMVRLGNLLGLAFQVRDDIFDVTATADALGKNPGSDEKNQKATYVSLFGLEKAGNIYEKLSHDALALVQSLPCKTTALHGLVTQIIAREK